MIEIQWGIWKTAFYLINAGLSMVVLALLIILKLQNGMKIANLTLNLTLFLKCAIPLMLLIPIGSLYMIGHYFIYGDEKGTWHLVVRIIMTFSSYTVRTTYLTICVERLFATILLHTYEKYITRRMGALMVLIMVVIAIACTVPVFFGEVLFIYSIHFVLVTHVITFILCITLIRKNRALHEKLSFNPKLNRRYQIVENLKVLRVIRPHLFLITFFAPIGPIITIVISTLTGAASPLPIIYSFYNFCFVSSLGILNREAYIRNKTRYTDVVPISGQRTIVVQNAFGFSLPAEYDIDGHFAELKKIWKN